MNLGGTIKKFSHKLNFALKVLQPTLIRNGQEKEKIPLVLLGNKMLAARKRAGENGEVGSLKNFKCLSSHSLISYQLGHLTFLENEEKIPYPVLRRITEPNLENRIKIELPLGGVLNKNVDLPSFDEFEKSDPVESKIIKAKTKKTRNILIIRRRKMKKHKLIKLRKKMKFEFAKKRQKRELKKELLFQTGLKDILKEGEDFSPEKYIQYKLDTLNWVPPVTRARGRLAPQWVIKSELERKRIEKLQEERVLYCINAVKPETK